MSSRQNPPRCPNCNFNLGEYTEVFGPSASTPPHGSLGVCAYCAELLVFEEAGGVRAMTFAEEIRLEDEERIKIDVARASARAFAAIRGMGKLRGNKSER